MATILFFPKPYREPPPPGSRRRRKPGGPSAEIIVLPGVQLWRGMLVAKRKKAARTATPAKRRRPAE
jgi:hypothetical protein